MCPACAVAVAPNAHPTHAQAARRRGDARAARSLLLLLWVQVAQRELGHGTAGRDGKAQAASGDVWPSLRRRRPPPTCARARACGAGAHEPARRRRWRRRRRRRGSGGGCCRRRCRRCCGCSPPAPAGCTPTSSSPRPLLRPDRVSATRLAGRGLPPSSLACALGLWSTQPAAALPISALLPALRAALTEVLAPATAAAEAKAAAAAAASAAAEASPPVSPRPPVAGRRALAAVMGGAAGVADGALVAGDDLRRRARRAEPRHAADR